MTPPPVLQFGIETEIGIARDNDEQLDVVAESIALVRSVVEPGVLMRWDYDSEDPHADMRGFRVPELRQDTDEANYYTQDAQRELSYVEIKSDLVLGNGARFYNDHAHPEYCTPECSTLDEVVTQDRAGERILMACAQQLSAQRGDTIRLYKNNTDFRGHSYGCHENYLITRTLPWGQLAEGIQAFLATRQIFAGAGKFAVEEEDQFISADFQISQRADFFSELQSVDTMQRRPLVNTRDEPHANPKLYRRFHVIVGDANMSPFATRLKVGVTGLVLEALVRDPRRAWPQLAEPLDALKAISRDPKFRWEVECQGGRRSTALDIQRSYLEAVKDVCDLSAPARAAVAEDWEAVLNDLAVDALRCRNRLDWVAKLAMVREFQASQNLAPDDPWLQSLDLEYHRLDLAEGLYYGLEQSGAMLGAPEETAVRWAMCEPPTTTRAYVRGKCIQKFATAVESAQWDHITLSGERGPLKISLMDLFAPEDVSRYARAVDRARSPEDLRTLKSVQ
ncbi:MAG TPA: proteasome accessory factor PafA2 family protein [Verrucomicrobiae bacterium]|jgi:proteasome accessory factor PafA2|nr:proteasome accessory factor PafA2 family protein [Verrucomicrobiae bacterium]